MSIQERTRSFGHARNSIAAVAFLITAAFMTHAACNTVPSENENNNQSNDVSVKIRADFSSPAARNKITAAREACPDTTPDQDSPNLEAGLDCDGDGGAVQYVTPSSYKVAIKRLAFLRENDGEAFEAIPDTGMLQDSVVLDITNPVTLEIDQPTDGVYTQYQVELYYYELTMPLYDADTTETLRIYMSDDNLPAEGNLGHHQGDITLIDANGNELGFVTTADVWQDGALLDSRGSTNGAGGTDVETGHLRGLFGDEEFWNQADFQQGAYSDICVITGSINLIAGDANQTVTFTLNVADSWFYEDFDANERFNPCDPNPGDACAMNAAWAPLFAAPEATIVEETTINENENSNLPSNNTNDNSVDNGDVS
jgi:hypothetical protein